MSQVQGKLVVVWRLWGQGHQRLTTGPREKLWSPHQQNPDTSPPLTKELERQDNQKRTASFSDRDPKFEHSARQSLPTLITATDCGMSTISSHPYGLSLTPRSRGAGSRKETAGGHEDRPSDSVSRAVTYSKAAPGWMTDSSVKGRC